MAHGTKSTVRKRASVKRPELGLAFRIVPQVSQCLLVAGLSSHVSTKRRMRESVPVMDKTLGTTRTY